MTDFLEPINAFAWGFSNVVVIYITIVLVLFTVGYYILFDPKATTAGKFVWRFALSLVGFIGLTVVRFSVSHIEGDNWFLVPNDLPVWYPLLRLTIYGYVAFTITSLAILLGVRKWKPEWIKIAPDKDVLKTRHDTQEHVVINVEGEKDV